MKLTEADLAREATLYHYEWCAEHHIVAPKVRADPPKYKNVDFKAQSVAIWLENDGRINYRFSFDQDGRIAF